VVGHYTKECRKVWQDDTVDGYYGKRDQNLSECVATLCATQVEGSTFFCIPYIPSLNHSKERVNMSIITVIKGSVTAKQLEEEFTRIMSGIWRWTAQKVANNKFIVRFPDVQVIRDWSKFNPIKLRTVNAKIQIDTWNNSIGAKAELQQAWFRVRGIPYDFRSKETTAYAGSLVGATTEVDLDSLDRNDYVRIKIAARDVSKIPGVAEGAILPYLYDFQYEREVEMMRSEPGIPMKVFGAKDSELSTPKKTKIGEQGFSQTQQQM
jgi:hypothetical protein